MNIHACDHDDDDHVMIERRKVSFVWEREKNSDFITIKAKARHTSTPSFFPLHSRVGMHTYIISNPLCIYAKSSSTSRGIYMEEKANNKIFWKRGTVVREGEIGRKRGPKKGRE